MVNQNQAQNQKQKQKRTPVCVYWDPDVGVYRIYLAEYVRGIGWIDRTYLGAARSLKELREIMRRFNYVSMCGADVDVSADAAPRRHADDCDAVAQLVGTC